MLRFFFVIFSVSVSVPSFFCRGSKGECCGYLLAGGLEPVAIWAMISLDLMDFHIMQAGYSLPLLSLTPDRRDIPLAISTQCTESGSEPSGATPSFSMDSLYSSSRLSV